MDVDMEVAFGPFRPYCSALAINPNQKVLSDLSDLVKKADRPTLQNLEEYILFPAQVYMKTPSMPENYTIKVLDFVRDFYLSAAHLGSEFVFRDLLRNIVVHFMNTKEKACSEDLKVSIAGCLGSMVGAAGPGVRRSVLHNIEFKNQISHVIFQALEWAEHETESSGVVVECIGLVNSFCVHGEAAFQRQFVDMLPGITSKLVKTLQKPVHKHSKDIIAALNTWANFVTAILDDASIEGRDDVYPPGYLDQAADHLLQHLQVICAGHTFVNHSNPNVRRAVLRVCQSIHQHCLRSLEGSINLMVQTLALMTVDTELADKAEKCLDNYLAYVAAAGGGLINSILEETQGKIYEVSTSLRDRESVRLDERSLEHTLDSLHGLLILLSKVEGSSTFFYSSTYVGRLLDGLSEACRLDTSILLGTNLLRDFTDFDFVFRPQNHLKLKRLDKAFVYLTMRAQKRLEAIVTVIGNCDNVGSVVEHLTKYVDDASSKRRREATFLINTLVSKMTPPISEEIVADLLNLYMKSPPQGQEVAVITDCAGPKDSWSDTCLTIEGIGKIALASSSSFCQDNIGQMLTFVLSQTDLTNSHSAHVLYFALEDMANASTQPPSILSMLRENRDFLCRELAILLRTNLSATGRKQRKSGGNGLCLPTLLKAVIRIECGAGSTESDELPALRDSIDALLMQLDLAWIDPNPAPTTEILRVIQIFVRGVCCDDNVGDAFKEDNSQQDYGLKPLNSRGRLTSLVKDLMASDETERKFLADDADEQPTSDEGLHHDKSKNLHQTDVDESEEEEDNRIVPDRVVFLRRTIEHTRHFVSMVNRPQWQLISLQVIADATGVVQMDKEELLPLVHQAWQPLKLLFKSDNIFVVEQAFRVLMVFGQTAKDFIHKRALTDVFPSLSIYVRRLQAMVSDRAMHQSLMARQARSLLQKMVGGMWDLMALLSLDVLESDAIIEQMLDFVDFAATDDASLGLADHSVKDFVPKRQSDHDILRLKLRNRQ